MADAIVIGSGMNGGIAARQLFERGLKVPVLERGMRSAAAMLRLRAAVGKCESLGLPWEASRQGMLRRPGWLTRTSNMVRSILADGREMVEVMESVVISQAESQGSTGLGIHEMGTTRMGTDPATSVLDMWNRTHDVKGLFITAGAAMAGSGCQNPSLTCKALTARADDHAVELLREGVL